MRRPRIPLLVFFVFLLVSCGVEKNSGNQAAQSVLLVGHNTVSCPSITNTTAAPPEKEPVTLKVSGWISSTAEDALVQANLNAFMKAHPLIHVQWTPIAGVYADQIKADYLNGTASDVFYLQPDMTSTYISAGKLLNLSPYMVRDHVKASDYYSSQISLFSCQAGAVYGLPKDWNTLGVFYNKKLFQAARVPFPQENWTWNDLRGLAKQLTNKDKHSPVYGLTLPAYSSRWLAFLFSNGGSVLNSDGTRAVFNSDAGVNALKFYTDFQRQDHSAVLPSKLVASWDGDDFDAFGQEKAAMVLEGGWLIPYLKNKYPSLDYSIAPLPLAPTGQRADLIFTNAWAANSNTRHPEAAWEFIHYMTGYEVQQSVLHSGFALPTLKSFNDHPSVPDNPLVKVLSDAFKYGQVDYYGPQNTFIHQRLDLATRNILLDNANVRSALDNAAQQIDKSLASP